MTGFGKLYPALYEGSMIGAGPHVFALWPYCLARADAKGFVEVNAKLAAHVIGCSIPDVESALDYLQRPDPESRSKDEDGRRLIREGQFLYRIVNYQHYRALRDSDERREYQREWDRTHRPSGYARAAGSPTQSDTVRQPRPKTTQAEAEAEAEAEKRENGAHAPSRARRPAPKFVPPTLDEVRAYVSEIGAPFAPEAFVAYYEERGWRWGAGAGHPMKDWRRAAVRWKANGYERPEPRRRAGPALVGSHSSGPARSLADAPPELQEISRRIARREDVSDEDADRLGRWLNGEAS